jgi:CRP/FNR family transcriptional regulator, cyclic AMP receptor protein
MIPDGSGRSGRPWLSRDRGVRTVPERRLLDTTDLFAAMPADVLASLSEQSTVRTLARNEVLFHQGDPSHALYVVAEGRIAIATHSVDGRESVIAVLEQGGLLGELPLFDDEPRVADARALIESTVIELEYAPVRKVLDERPELLWIIVRLLVHRLRATDEALADAVFLDVPARTAKRLLELAAGSDRFTLPVTQEELAAMVGASRERVNKAIALFVRLGWLEVEGRNNYHILDREAMEERVSL